MNSDFLSLAVISTALLIGASLPFVVQGSQDFRFNASELKQDFSHLKQGQDKNEGSGLVQGTAHRHALFHVVVNGTEKDFTARKFQLNSKYVHLEKNRSEIVHSHAEGVTWKKFFETINTSVSQNQSYVCLEIYGNSSCGEGLIVLNGERDASLDKKIQQGDSFLVIMETENRSAIIEEYMKKQLPQLYKSSKNRGHRI